MDVLTTMRSFVTCDPRQGLFIGTIGAIGFAAGFNLVSSVASSMFHDILCFNACSTSCLPMFAKFVECRLLFRGVLDYMASLRSCLGYVTPARNKSSC